MYIATNIAHIIGANCIGSNTNEINYLLIDSRQLIEPKHTLFIALHTTRSDAHKYCFELYQKGVRQFLVHYIPDNCKELTDASFLIVNDTLKALQALAAHHRQQYSIPVIAITGSNGKTIVKEWLYQLLKDDYTICRSPKSYNSQIGVPLSVWQLQSLHTLAIFEAGISEVGEMEKLQAIIQPTIGVLTSIGSSHDEGFANENEKLNEKLKLFSDTDTLIINALSINSNHLSSLPKYSQVISKDNTASLQITSITKESAKTVITGIYKKHSISLSILFTDSASIENAITCWTLLLQLGIDNDTIQQRMLLLQPVAMRLELKLGNNNCVLINDFYNSDINALEIALHHQKQQYRGGKKVVILSDIEQSGKQSNELYSHIAKLITQFDIDIFVGIGKEISSQKRCFNSSSYFFETTEAFIFNSKLNVNLQFNNAIILLKAARSFGFERISKLLQQKSHDTVLEINLNNLVHNINFYRSQINATTKLMCMVKATAYGSGSTEIAFTLQHHNVDYLAVAYTDEGVELRKAGIHLPIMVMSPEESSYDDMIEYRLEPEIYSFKVLHEFLQALQLNAVSQPYPVHIKLDTGMKRLGFEEHELPQLIALLQKEKLLHVKSIFSHLVASDNDAFDEFTNYQLLVFEKATSTIDATIGYNTLKHICNSGAITRFKQAHYSMVRLGIGMYGVGFNTIEKENLKNSSSLKTRISQLKKLQKGETVGYNRLGVATKPTTTATIPIGYADGFGRKLGNGNSNVFINGIGCKTIGNICMDMCMIDVTEVDCKEGDEVIIFETHQQLMELSKAMDTIPYEVLTSISTRVKRVYIQE